MTVGACAAFGRSRVPAAREEVEEAEEAKEEGEEAEEAGVAGVAGVVEEEVAAATPFLGCGAPPGALTLRAGPALAGKQLESRGSGISKT